MLTIRWYESAGHQTLLETRRVSSHPPDVMASPAGTGFENDVDHLFYEMEDGSTAEIATGTVYVMNSNGKTVAVYHLKYPELSPVEKAQLRDGIG